jgi:chemotaxis protein methyltransferase CheR
MDSTHPSSPDFAVPTPEELGAFRDIIRRHTGLQFEAWRSRTIGNALCQRMTANGLNDVAAYLAILGDDRRRAEEFVALFDHITVNETFFFRYPAQFEHLRAVVMPALFKRQQAGGQPIRVWSAGCSTGEEPYSIGITALDLIGHAAAAHVQVFATDVSAAALDAARRGDYSARSLRLLSAAHRALYFRPSEGGRLRVVDAVRRMVQFSRSNFMDDLKRSKGLWDVIFCRNVLIYQAPEVVAQAYEGLWRSLRDDGVLFLGHSEAVDRNLFLAADAGALFVHRKRWGTAAPQAAATLSERYAAAAHAVPPAPVAAPHAAPDADRLFQEAWRLFAAEDFSRARECLDRLLEGNPVHLRGTLLRALVLLNQGHLDASVEECENALQVDPLAHEAYLLLGLNFARAGSGDIGVVHLRKAAYLAPDSCVVHFHLAEACRALGLREDALRAYRHAKATLEKAADAEIAAYVGGFGRPALAALLNDRLAAST